MSIITDKVAQCPTCHQAKHLLNMLSGSELCEAINEMVRNNENYQLDNGILKKKSGNDWLPIGYLSGDGCSTDGVITNYFSINIGTNASSIVIVNEENHVLISGNNSYGQHGLNHTSDVHEFTDTGLLAAQVITSGKSIYVRDLDNKLWVSGNNEHGELGLGDTTNRLTFTDTGLVIKDMYAAWGSAIVINMNDDVLSTGLNDHGQLGLGNTDDVNIWTNVGIKAKKVKMDGEFGVSTYLIKLDNELLSCGYNVYGQLGIGGTSDTLTFTSTNKFVKKLSTHCSYYIAMIIDLDDKVWGTGWNNLGQLGLGSHNNEKHSFTDTGMTAIDLSLEFTTSYLLTSNNELYVAGGNDSGQLGLGDTTDRHNWTLSATNVHSIKINDNSGYYTDLNGKIYSAGRNSNGQLSTGDDVNKTSWYDTGVIGSDLLGSCYSMIATNDINEMMACGSNTTDIFGMDNGNNDVTTFTNLNKKIKSPIANTENDYKIEMNL